MFRRGQEIDLFPYLNGLTAMRVALAVFCALSLVGVRPMQAQTLQVLHSFSGTTDGLQPYDLTLDRGGNLYGNTVGRLLAGQGRSPANAGPVQNDGTVFKLTHKNGAWTFGNLYTFQGNNGARAYSNLVFGPDGALYGTTVYGGANDMGIIFVLRPPQTFCRSVTCPWGETILYNFTGGTDSYGPQGNLVFDSSGNLYGTANGSPDESQGSLWQLAFSGGTWTFNVLHDFTGLQGDGDGALPAGGVILSGGNLYGTTIQGGSTDDAGTVFQATPSGSGWTVQVIYNFDGTYGAYPMAGVVADPSGNLFGASYIGSWAFGLTPSQGSWNFTPIEQLTNNGPLSNLTLDSQGNLYGVIPTGGANKLGTIFKLSQSGGSWTYTDLYDFTGGNDGSGPIGSVIFDGSGNMYGTASSGGSGGYGTVWELTP